MSSGSVGGGLPIYRLNRLRIGVDGPGVRTLVAVHGCPLRCRYCLNAESHEESGFMGALTAQELYEVVAKDELYYRATGGGVTFGGGEPALYADFIADFAKMYCKNWSVMIETSLSVPAENVEKLIPVTDRFFVDIKATEPHVYKAYTGGDFSLAWDNLCFLAEKCPEKVTVRIPLIPKFIGEEDQREAARLVEGLGLTYELFEYRHS